MCEVVEDVVNILSDDEVLEDNLNGKHVNNSIKNQIKSDDNIIETIDLDGLPSSQNSISDNNNTIDLSNDGVKTIKDLPKLPSVFSGLYHKNPLLAELVEKCLELENSDGMARIINKTLMSKYIELLPEYRESQEFQNELHETMTRIDKDPRHKFSHLKSLCEAMSKNKKKKRVKLITLATDLKKNGIKRKSEEFGSAPKHMKLNIVLDSDEEENIPVINLEEEQEQNQNIIILDDQDKENCQVKLSQQSIYKNSSENGNSSHKPNIQIRQHKSQNQGIIIQNIDLSSPGGDENSQNRDNNENSGPKLLEVQVEVGWEPNSQPDDVNRRTEPVLPIESHQNDSDLQIKINALEARIAHCKELIQTYDEAEVTDDSTYSPYIMSERLKQEVVKLYEELCNLTGHIPVKHHKVHLQVLEGHPAGPVKKLERFLNGNIGRDGEPPFPDFCDVVKCVIQANVEDGLRWSKQQVFREATSLFVHCGSALQKRRQQREYRDLLSHVKEEHHDPADDDLELRARLEANRRLALRKENEIIERYAMMENLPPRTNNSTTQTLTNGHDDDDDVIVDSPSQDTENDLIDSQNASNSTTLTKNKMLVLNPFAKQSQGITNDCNFKEKVPENLVTGDLVKSNNGIGFNANGLKTDYCRQINNQENEAILRNCDRESEVAVTNNFNTKSNTLSNVVDIHKSDVNSRASQIEPKLCFEVIQTNTNEIPTEFEQNSTKIVVLSKPTMGDEKMDVATNVGKTILFIRNKELDTQLSKDKSANLEPNLSQSNAMVELHTEIDIPNSEEMDVKIKKEPEEAIIQRLDDLGDDYTVSVIDIFDPFESIVISSDSSDGEND